MRIVKAVVVVALLAGSLSACATDEYTTSEAKRDLVKVGLTEKQASCVLDSLRKHYGDQYVALNNSKKVDRVNPDAVALYVRNVFASQQRIGNDDAAFAKTALATCKK